MLRREELLDDWARACYGALSVPAATPVASPPPLGSDTSVAAPSRPTLPRRPPHGNAAQAVPSGATARSWVTLPVESATSSMVMVAATA